MGEKVWTRTWEAAFGLQRCIGGTGSHTWSWTRAFGLENANQKEPELLPWGMLGRDDLIPNNTADRQRWAQPGLARALAGTRSQMKDEDLFSSLSVSLLSFLNFLSWNFQACTKVEYYNILYLSVLVLTIIYIQPISFRLLLHFPFLSAPSPNCHMVLKQIILSFTQ